MTVSSPPTAPPTQRTFFGLPRTMYPVAGFAAFDALAFYGMQTILVYYVYFAVAEGGLALSTDVAIAIVSTYSAATFLATIFMGWLADNVLGAGRGLRWGAVLALAGYLVLAAVPGEVGLATGLIAIAFGAASMWVSEGAVLGGTLNAHESKRESGFTVYYLGSAGGALVGITLTGVLQSEVGFRLGFLASAVAILIGLLVYLPFRRSTEATAPVVHGHGVKGWALAWPILAVALGVAAIIGTVAAGSNPSTIVGLGALVLAAGMFVKLFSRRDLDREHKRRVLHYLPFFGATAVFAMLYQQLYTTVAIHSEASTDRVVFGIELPPSTVLGIAPLCTIIVAPILATLWGALGDRQPSLAVKFAIAFGGCALAMGWLAAASGTGELTPIIVLVVIVFVFGASDVVVSPSGLSLASAVAPAGFETRMLSLHYLGAAIGIAAAGVAGEGFSPGENETAYFAAFAVVGAVVAVAMIFVRFAFGKRLIATDGTTDGVEVL
ncbi:peptide MFS transporter [Agromyces lapidis]|uniref:Peptide MFS transporter n=1 Tax=Agromyces lapidis TaxID=279574 RepID=A0ABV5SS62_9MICO|nr:oligopeptide:H+ symporter [Agromyces lapidis]